VLADLQGFLIAAAVTAAVAIPIRRLALGFGILDRPGSHKSHSEAVPYLGGLAIWLGLIVALAVSAPGLKRIPALLTVILVLGLVDDLFSAKVIVKLAVESSVAIAAVGLGFTWQITDSYALNVGLSLLWIIGLTNAFNLLDNMDGLSSVVAAAGLVGLVILSPVTAIFALPMTGALIGFLIWNRPPARMYMGDAGSLMLGFALSIATITAANRFHGLHSLALLVGPVAVALFDTSLVVVSRLLAGLPIQVGGKDHFSHRLQSIGWSKPQVLGAALVAATSGSAAAFLASTYPRAASWLAVPVAVFAGVAWLWLLRMNPYSAKIQLVEAREATGA
jgi:UDP-GlcNAc:undecaprenyl-phosphate/decaprenyl-phosphate GlcNAc-1-phosphate transferase